MVLENQELVMQSRKIHLACGKNVLKGWENYDLFPCNNSVTKIDLLQKMNFEDNSIDFIFFEHAIEHFDEVDGFHIIQECYRILKKGGVMRILTPSLDTYVRRFNEWGEDFNTKHRNEFSSRTAFLNYAFYGEHATGLKFLDGKRSYDIGHRFIYSFEDLEKKLKKCGFLQVTEHDLRQSKHPELCNIDCRVDNLDIILEAQK